MPELEHPWSIEERCFSAGYRRVCGVDEAGAGPLAGPVYAAAVILPPGLVLEGLNDSKKLSPKRREALFDRICAEAEAYSVAWVEAEEIDRIDILNARMKAMQLAIDGLPEPPDMALIDGDRDHGSLFAVRTPHETVVGGDGKSASIAAASILAKVSRDRFVCGTLDAAYPQYQFAKHKGYGTKLHYEMLDRYGPCPAHRRSFLKKWERRT
ncbi:ribonuclease HII [uncultured Oscillibacter sp.]|uniref:ribonuclease HII n=1 Tax=uncultured Oscillibacter sp. TaxID=876091 RepID=UPI00260114E6|nr:ribonuclease HII [uncultured Oscillibacter sp.]